MPRCTLKRNDGTGLHKDLCMYIYISLFMIVKSRNKGWDDGSFGGVPATHT